MGLAHARFGKLPWKDVLEPARRLAHTGFPASQRMELTLALQVAVMKQFPETAKIFLHGADRPLKQGEIVRQPALAATIARIARHGWREFYEGATAHLIDRDMAAHNGTIRYEDLRSYSAIEREPVKGTFRGNRILSMPPSSSGGFTLTAMLNIFETIPPPIGMQAPPEQLPHTIESSARACRYPPQFAHHP